MASCLIELGKKISAELISGKKLLECNDLLKDYCGCDWEDHKIFCCEKYKRNEVYKDEHIEILLICWSENQKTPVHDHPTNGCLVKVICGNLTEEIYAKDDTDSLICTKTNKLSTNDISYQEGKNGLHRIINGDKKACTLHIYAPPNYIPNKILD